MARYNFVILIGNLTDDIEFTPATDSSEPRASLSLATPRVTPDGQGHHTPDLYTVIAFGSPAEAAAELKKGSPVFIAGLAPSHNPTRITATRISRTHFAPNLEELTS